MCRGTSVPDGEGLRLIFPDGKPSAEVRVFCVPLRLLSLHNTSNLLLPIYEPQRKPKCGYLCATHCRCARSQVRFLNGTSWILRFAELDNRFSATSLRGAGRHAIGVSLIHLRGVC